LPGTPKLGARPGSSARCTYASTCGA
jgi:hypothetical protein